MVTSEPRPKCGINFVCSSCRTLLYHIGPETENMRNSSSRYPRDAIFAELKKCSKCGHELNLEIDANQVKILPATPREFTPERVVHTIDLHKTKP